MICPFCKNDNDKVVDSRVSGDSIRRRRECTACGRRFTTREYIEIQPLIVVKRNGDREPFQREKLLAALKGLPLTVKAPRPVDEAVVTRGGVSVKEIEPGTMRSKLVPNLFFAGEMIDVDAHTGGFNLPIAWSTGALAGASAANNYEL